MSNSSKKLLDLIKQTSKSTNELNSKIISLKIKTLNPLEFIYNEKLILDKQFYVLDKNFSLTDLKDDQGNVYDLQVGDTVTAMMTNNGQTYYVLANKSIGSGGGGGGTSDYLDLDNKPSINNVTLSGNKTTSDLGINIPTKTSDLQNDSGFGTYSKPTTGIPKTDLAVAVQTSLGLADTALQNSDISTIESDILSSIGETITEITAQSQKIWELNTGVYKIRKGNYILYDNNALTAKWQSSNCDSLLIVRKSDDFTYYYNWIYTGTFAYGSIDLLGSATYTVKNCETTSNKVTSISSSSTNTQYPGAKLLYDQLQLKTNHDNVAKDFWYGTQAEYDALVTKDANTIYMTDGIDQGDIYSTTEQRVGTWIDGKPLYEKTIVYNSAITSQNTSIPHNINNIDVAFIVSGFAKFQNQYFTFSSYTNSSNFICAYDINNTSIDVYTGSGWRTSFENGMTIIIRYTKTTD